MITALVVMYNSESFLDNRFKSLWFCDEIIAIDLGSKDNSINIAKKYNCIIKHNEWVPMGELAWINFVKDATNDWIIIADPDEIIPNKLANKIISTLNNISDNIGIIGLPYRHHFMGKKVNISMWKEIHYINKIFHRDRITLHGLVHSPFCLNEPHNILNLHMSVDESDVVLHYPGEKLSKLCKKLFRYSLMEGKSKYERGERWTIKSCLKYIAASIWYNLKKSDVFHNLKLIYLPFMFIGYDILSQISLFMYQFKNKHDKLVEILQIEPTRRCNMNCKHCNHKDNNGYISIDTFEKILSKHANVEIIKIQGLGEPLLHPNIGKLIELSHKHNSKVMIITNGSVPIPSGIDQLIISLETVNPLKYKEIRNYDLEKVLLNIRYIATKQKVIANCVQTNLTNEDDVEEVKAFTESINGELWITPMEVWYDNLHKEYPESLKNVIDAYITHNINLKFRNSTCRWLTKRYLYYDYLGRMHPCCIRMTDEYLVNSDFDFTNCCKTCPM
jgi:organic radical activating enzyme